MNPFTIADTSRVKIEATTTPLIRNGDMIMSVVDLQWMIAEARRSAAKQQNQH